MTSLSVIVDSPPTRRVSLNRSGNSMENKFFVSPPGSSRFQRSNSYPPTKSDGEIGFGSLLQSIQADRIGTETPSAPTVLRFELSPENQVDSICLPLPLSISPLKSPAFVRESISPFKSVPMQPKPASTPEIGSKTSRKRASFRKFESVSLPSFDFPSVTRSDTFSSFSRSEEDLAPAERPFIVNSNFDAEVRFQGA